MSYTIIRWEAVDRLGVSLTEYILLDTIHGFSLKTGWCYASRTELARSVRMTRRWVFTTLESLSKRGLVEAQPQTRYLRCTPQWTDALAGSPPQVSQLQTPQASGENNAPASEENAPVDEENARVQKLPDSGETTAPAVVQSLHPTGEISAPNNNSNQYSSTIQEKNKKKKDASASDIFLLDAQPNETNAPADQERNTLGLEPTPLIPPPVASPPSLVRVGEDISARSKDAKRSNVLTEPCLVACREMYLRHFPDYGWKHGRDDKFLKETLAQIRDKITLCADRAGQTPDQSDEQVMFSFEGLLGKIPDWYVRNGHTTPADLNRHFEKFYAAIKAGQGGGGSASLTPATDRDQEYFQLMRLMRGG